MYKPWIIKNENIKKLYKKYEIKKIILKSLLYCDNYPFIYKLLFDFHFKKFPYQSSISKYRTYCLILGNSRSILRTFKLSRHSSKILAFYGNLTGLRKSSF